MTTLEKAARQALEALEYTTIGTLSGGNDNTKKAIASLRQALEQKQEPVGEVNRHGLDSHGRKWHGIHWYDANVDVPHGTKLYTEPPQRNPLTEMQIEAISKGIERSDFFDCVVPFARAIEQAHGIGELK